MLEVLSGAARYVFSSKNSNGLKVCASMVLDLATTAINIIAPIIIADSVHGNTTDDGENHHIPMIVAASSLIMAQALPRISNMLTDNVRANVQKEITVSMVEKTFDSELDTRVNERTGDFAQALSKNYSSVDKGIPAFFGDIIPSVIEVLSISSYLTAKFGYVGLAPAGILLVYGVVATVAEKSAESVRGEAVKESYRGYGAVLRGVGNYSIAHYFGNVQHEMSLMEKALKLSEDKFWAMHYKDDGNSFILSLINGVGFAGSLVLFFVKPPGGSLDPIAFALFAYFMTRINARLDVLPGAVSSFNTAVSDGKKIFGYLNKTIGILDTPSAIALEPHYGLEIEFKNVSFSYGSTQILDNLNFHIRSGEKFAIVGETGSGKSTIFKLMMRFYEPNSGHILINGRNINDYTIESLRRAFSVVAQDSTIFEGNIRSNIGYGDLNAPESDIVKAAMHAQLIDDPSSRRLEDPAGNAGGKLSGGEKQRVTIARALLKGGSALLLDEPTSALDATTESKVQQMLDSLNGRCTTTVLVTHRLTTVINADNIICLKDGRITDFGKFEDILRVSGEFQTMFQSQCDELGIDPRTVSAAPRSSTVTEASTFWTSKTLRGTELVHSASHTLSIN